MQQEQLDRYGRVPFRIGSEVVYNQITGFMMAKNSPWKNKIDEIIEGL